MRIYLILGVEGLKAKQKIGELYMMLKVECDEQWKVKKAEDVQLIGECQGV